MTAGKGISHSEMMPLVRARPSVHARAGVARPLSTALAVFNPCG
jgi:hypothetical protein